MSAAQTDAHLDAVETGLSGVVRGAGAHDLRHCWWVDTDTYGHHWFVFLCHRKAHDSAVLASAHDRIGELQQLHSPRLCCASAN